MFPDFPSLTSGSPLMQLKGFIGTMQSYVGACMPVIQQKLVIIGLSPALVGCDRNVLHWPNGRDSYERRDIDQINNYLTTANCFLYVGLRACAHPDSLNGGSLTAAPFKNAIKLIIEGSIYSILGLMISDISGWSSKMTFNTILALTNHRMIIDSFDRI